MELLTLLFALQSLFIPTLATQCYWPNGSNATSNWIPCPNSKVCCATGEACLSNGLCYEANLNIAHRGACSDTSWPISECPRVCYEEVPNGWANLYACPNNTNQYMTCGTPGWASDVCEKNLGVYSWTSGYVSVGYLTSSSTAASASSTTKSFPTTSGAALTTPTEHTPQPSSSSSSSSDHQVALGAGLGVGLGVPFLALATCMVWFCVRSNRQVEAMQMQNAQLLQQKALAAQVENPRELQSEAPRGELEGWKPPRTELEG